MGEHNIWLTLSLNSNTLSDWVTPQVLMQDGLFPRKKNDIQYVFAEILFQYCQN